MSAPVHGIRCQSGVRLGTDPTASACRAEISGAASERDLFVAAETFGFERVNGVWLCPACKRDAPRLGIVKPNRAQEKSRPNLCYCETCGPEGAVHVAN